METTTVGDIPIQRLRDGPVASQNPYILPFAMRGLLEEEYVRTELYDETTELLKLFDEWKPSSKVLKDGRSFRNSFYVSERFMTYYSWDISCQVMVNREQNC